MKSVVLSVLATGAATQITLGPLGGLGLSPELFQNAAINPSDPEYATCQDAVSLVQKCVSSVGGLQAAPTADASALVACACCDGRENAAPLYSVCSKYLEDEAPDNTSQYEAYGTLYSACKIGGAKCTGGSGSGGSGSASASSRPTATEEDDDRSTITTQTSPAQQTYASACVDMLGIFTSCTAKDRDFTNLPFKEQAECYCCRGSGNSLTWTDAMDKYAQTCADWARTGESKTAYSVAQTFATFCERFSNVCEFAGAQTQGSDSEETTQASTTENSSSRQTDDSNGDNSNDSETSSNNNNNNAGPVTVTVNSQPTETGNDATSARAGFGAVLAVVAALAITL